MLEALISDQYKYVSLMAGLPRPAPLFAEKRPPLSRLRLEKRLQQLDPSDADLVYRIESALEWRSLSGHTTDEDVIGRFQSALNMTESVTLKNVIKRRMDLRICLSALRSQRAGHPPPNADAKQVYGRWLDIFISNWRSSTLSLDKTFPWIKDAVQFLEDNDANGVEKLLLETVYRDLSREGGLHEFDLEAVTIYVLKWNIIDRWSRYNSEAASRRFSKLLEAGLSNSASAQMNPI